jgi:hypothetical protein
MAWFDRPAEHSQHFQLAASQRVDQAGHCRGSAGPGIWRGILCLERALQPGQAAERDLRGGLPGPLGRDQPAQQRGHRRALVGEDPDITRWAGQG